MLGKVSTACAKRLNGVAKTATGATQAPKKLFAFSKRSMFFFIILSSLPRPVFGLHPYGDDTPYHTILLGSGCRIRAFVFAVVLFPRSVTERRVCPVMMAYLWQNATLQIPSSSKESLTILHRNPICPVFRGW